MGVIFNYTPYSIIVNIRHENIVDHSDINNYKYYNYSIIIPKNERSANVHLRNSDNIYICSENCKFLGHFDMMNYKLHDDFTIYVGLVINGKLVTTNPGAIPSDVNFGISREIDQSQFWVMLLNPYFYLTLIVMVIIIIITYACACWCCLSNY